MKRLLLVLLFFSTIVVCRDFKSFIPTENIWKSNIRAIQEEGNYIWIGAERGLFKLNKTTGELTLCNQTNDLSIAYMAIDGSGNKWLTIEGGLAKYDGSIWTYFNTSNSGLPSNRTNALCIDGSGNKWIGTDAGLVKFNDTTWTVFNTSNSSLPSNYIATLAIDNNGNKWIGFNGLGVVKFDGTMSTLYDMKNFGFSNDYICKITIDKNGSVWVSTFNGLAKLDGSSGVYYNSGNSGLTSYWVFGVAIDLNGNKWICQFGGGLIKFDDTNWTLYNKYNSGLLTDSLTNVIIDNHGNKWIGTFHHGLIKYDGTIWTVYNTGDFGYISTAAMTPQYKKNEFILDISIGDPTTLIDLYGISFTLSCNNTFCAIVDSGAIKGDFLGSSIIFFPKKINNQTIDIGITKTSAPGVNGSGVIARVKFTSSDSIKTIQNAIFKITNVKAIDSQGNDIYLNPADSITVIILPGVNVWPGDANNDGTANTTDVLNIGLYYNQTNGTTPTSNNPGIFWQTYIRTPWPQDGNTPLRIYSDCNGDGIINVADILPLGLNYNKTHSLSSSAFKLKTNSLINRITTKDKASIKVLTPTQVKGGETFTVQIKIGDPVTISDLYGISFTLKSKSTNCSFVESSATKGGFLDSSVIFFPYKVNNQRVDVGISKINLPGANGSGIIASFKFISSVNETVVFSLSNLTAIDSQGNIIPIDSTSTSVVVPIEKETPLPTQYKLEQNYPNPFNPTTMISFSLPQSGFVNITVTDIMGKKIQTLIDEDMSVGTHVVGFNAKGLSSGIYFYTIRTSSFIQTKKMLLLK